ncbi:protein goliath-like [Anopheles arabiensis]|uniref:AGAP003558-PA n=3 Tax=gambiae species complex TaxID=44542 RepID=A0NDJ4_ANOGA|nr:protein goliath-like [Anopheles arabiensis]XP_040222368.1 protein goliath-like [Anopheles coluzzii]EAU76906.1 AGAP003558-PA [Anopheles gambiae str. PEST]
MVLPQILTFATSLSIVALAAIGLIYYFENHTEQRRAHTSRPGNNGAGQRSDFTGRYNPQDEDIYCTICLEEIRPTSRWTLPCRHSFHLDCLDKWMVNKQECPNCRKQI